MNLPEQYLENMKELLGTDFDAYIESFNDSRLYGLPSKYNENISRGFS